MKLSEAIVVNDEQDVMAIDGQWISGDLLRAFTRPSPPDVWFRVASINGVATIETKREFRDSGLQ